MSGDTLLNNRYRLVAQQGSGGMAVIYKAIDESLGRTVAVKILRPSLTADPTFIARFKNEARSIANLTHPNIVTVHDVGNEGMTNYIVMEFIEGQDLKKVIRAQGALDIDRALNLSISICAGLGFAHRAGIVHADVKPQNILLSKDDIVKITDFGIAQALSDTQPAQRQSVVWGSPHYFAPEQAQGEKPSAASDVYSIGIVMFELLTGRLPFTGTNQQELALAHIRDRIPSATEVNPAVPETLSNIIEKVMAKSPRDRYSTADQLGHVLIAYRDRGRQHTVQAPPSTERPSSPSSTSESESDSRPVTPPPPAPTVRQQPRQAPPPPEQVPQANPYAHRFPSGNSADPAASMPTQRYSSAPNAPEVPTYNRGASIPSPSGSQPDPYGNRGGQGAQPSPRQGFNTDSRPYGGGLGQSQPYRRTEEAPSTLDGVTIALAVIALMAVACLIPLYIIVLNARLG